MRKVLRVSLATAALVLSACGGGSSGGSAGDPARGEALFKQSTIGSASAPGCSTCHSLNPGETIVGPSQAGVATRVDAVLKSGQYSGPAKTVEEYLRESIVSPDAHVTEGFQPGVMYPNFGKELSEQELNDLVAYLATLK
jgi:nitric oxide reductase subunit C